MATEEKDKFTNMYCRVCGTKWDDKHAKMCPVCNHGTGRALQQIQYEIQRLEMLIGQSTAQLEVARKLRAAIDRPFS